MFTFVLSLLLLAFCFIEYLYFTNQIISQRKRIMLLINENNQLKNKLSKVIADCDHYRHSDSSTPPPIEAPDDIE